MDCIQFFLFHTLIPLCDPEVAMAAEHREQFRRYAQQREKSAESSKNFRQNQLKKRSPDTSIWMAASR